MYEYILTRYPSKGKIFYSWGPKDKENAPDALITWNYKWLRREAFKLKVGESKVYQLDYNYDVINEKQEKVKDFLIDVYFWFREDWKDDLKSFKYWVKRKWEWLCLSKEERYRIKRMWDGIQIVPMHATTFDANDIVEAPIDKPEGKLFYLDVMKEFAHASKENAVLFDDVQFDDPK